MEMVMPDGTEASADLGPLRTAYARRLVRRVAESAGRSDVARALLDLYRVSPDRALAIVLDPTLSVAIETGITPPSLASLAVALARVGAIGSKRRALAPVRTVASLDANMRVTARTSLDVADHTLWVDDVPVAIDDESADVARPFPSIVGRIRLALVDPNPLAMHETHPDKEGNGLSLGDRPLGAWLASLRTALGLIEAHLPAIAAEMHAMLRLVIPVGASDERHLSASYREYIGAVYLTLHRDPVTMAEALVHEFQHNKLNLLSWHYPILDNGYDFLYRSPVRPDPRPLMGILLAAHAFVPVAELYRRLLASGREDFDVRGVRHRLAGVVARNEEALAVLDRHAAPARAGELVLDRLRALHVTHRSITPDLPENVSHVA